MCVCISSWCVWEYGWHWVCVYVRCVCIVVHLAWVGEKSVGHVCVPTLA